MATASAEAAASAATSAAATAAAAALFKVASNLWMAEASAVGPLLLPEGENFTTCYSQRDTGDKRQVQLQAEVRPSPCVHVETKQQQVLPTALKELTPPLFCLDRCSLWHTEHMPLVLGLP